MELIKIISLAGLSIILGRIYLSIRRNKNQPKHHAAERLCEAFMDEIQDLSLGRGDALETLKRAFLKHESAYIRFRPYLKGKVLRQFDEAWREYYCCSQENPKPFRQQYLAAEKETIAKEKRQLALKKILKILSFAKKSFVLKVHDNARLIITRQSKG